MLRKISKEEFLKRYAEGERNFQEYDFTGMNLSGALLAGINLSRSQLIQTKLTEANLSNSILINANLSAVTLDGANLNRANLTRATLKKASLNQASLRVTILLEADLSGAVMGKADLYKARLRRANLTDADLSTANLSEANLVYITYNSKTLFPKGFSAKNAAKVWADDYPLPLDPSNEQGWDCFWESMIPQKMGDEIFDYLGGADTLRSWAAILKARGCNTILFAGNGISLEPLIFADMGFVVTVLDISAKANRFLTNLSDCIGSNRELFERQIELLGLSEQSIQNLIPSVKIVTGDIYQTTCCPGPFDIMITRRTLQCYWNWNPDAENQNAGNKVIEGIKALFNRLSCNGLLYFHCHNFHFLSEEFDLHNWLATQGVSLVDSINTTTVNTNQRLFYLRETSG